MKFLLFIFSVYISLFADEGSYFDTIMNNEFNTTKLMKNIKNKKKTKINFSGMLKIRSYHFFHSIENSNANDDRNYLDGLAEITAKSKKNKFIESATLFSMIGTDYTTYGYGDFLNEFRDNGRKVPIGGIKELYLLYSNNNYDILIGKKVFKIGISKIYSPSNIYDTILAPDPTDPYTIGTWLIKISYYNIHNTEYSFVFFPFLNSSKIFSNKSRWAVNENLTTEENSTTTSIGSITVSNVTLENYNIFLTRLIETLVTEYYLITNTNTTKTNIIIEEDTSNKSRFLFRIKSNKILFNRGIDYMINIGYGPSIYTILEYTDKKNVYFATRPKSAYISSGFSTTYKKFEFHGEVFYQHSIACYDDDFISLVGGFSHNLDKWVQKLGFNDVRVILEYVKGVTTHNATNPNTFLSSKAERIPNNDLLIKLDGKINEKFSLTYLSDFRLERNNQNDAGRYQKVSVNYKIKDGLNSDLFVESFNGDVNSYYVQWKRNDRIGVDLKYNF